MQERRCDPYMVNLSKAASGRETEIYRFHSFPNTNHSRSSEKYLIVFSRIVLPYYEDMGPECGDYRAFVTGVRECLRTPGIVAEILEGCERRSAVLTGSEDYVVVAYRAVRPDHVNVRTTRS